MRWRSGRTSSTTRLHRALRERPSLRPAAARRRAARGARRHRHDGRARKAQVDYGDGPMVRHPQTGKYRRTRLFVLTLAHSRKAVRLLVWHSSAQTWAELHERAFRRLGGTPRTVVLDNLKEGVLTPDVYDPTLNPLYRDVLAHYGVVGLPCRVGDPDRKGKVESGHRPHAEDAAARPALRDARAGAGLSRSLGGALGRHAHPRHDEAPSRRDVCRGAAGAPAAAGRAVSLLPLRRAHRASRRLRRSRGRVLLDAARLDRPARPGAVDRPPRPPARSQDRSAPARACPRAARASPHRRRRPPGADAAGTLALLARARHAGAHLHTVCTYIHDHEGAAGVRRILGVLALAKKYGPAVADDAAKAALELQVPTYRFLRRYLERRPAGAAHAPQVDPLIRQLTLYRDLIDRQTGDPRHESRRTR